MPVINLLSKHWLFNIMKNRMDSKLQGWLLINKLINKNGGTLTENSSVLSILFHLSTLGIEKRTITTTVFIDANSRIN